MKYMKIKPLLNLIIFSGSFIFFSCEKENNESDSKFEFTGIIEKQSFTTYQYGTHVISNNEEFYALTSSTIDLDQYIGKEVEIEGTVIEYYVADGPEYIEVTEVE